MIKKLSEYCLQCKNPLCIKGCPVNNQIPEIIKLILNDQILEAYKLNLNTSVLPYTCGLLCPHEKQCEGNCIRGKKGKSVEIGKIESELAKQFKFQVFKLDEKLANKNIAVVGGGISGLSCALDLSRHGASVTIFEKNDKLGGPVRFSIPNFRFNDSFYNNLDSTLKELNVNVLYNKELGVNLFIDELNKFDNIVYSLGTELQTKPLNFSHERFVSGVEVLEKLKSGYNFKEIKTAIVIGAGNVATDVARALKRIGIDTSLVYRRAFVHSPALKSEINDCVNDQVLLNECLSPVSIEESNGFLNLICEKTQITNEIDRSNRPIYKGINEYIDLKADLIVYATGSKPNLKYLSEIYPNIINNGWINTKEDFYKYENCYFIGDMVTGPKSIVSAMRSSFNVTKDLINSRIYFMFGGSFDPVTKAHVEVIKHVVEKYREDDILIYIVPNGDVYNFGGKELTLFIDRKEMLEIALQKYQKVIKVLDIEQVNEFKGIYYTLQELDNPYYIIGSDLLYTLPVWKKAEELISENKFYLIERENYNLDILSTDKMLSKYRENFIISNFKLPDISSSKIREGKTIDDVPEGIKDYILEKNLYNKEVK